MLSKNRRVPKKLFTEILEKGFIFHGYFFTFRYLKTETLHLAFVVPKKVLKGAVKRNKLRRRGYYIINKLKLNTISGIFFYKKNSINKSHEDLEKDIIYILKKNNFLQ